MIKKILAAMLALFAAVAFAATDVNTATQTDLEAIKGIGPSISAKILDERKKGPFKDWPDLVTRVKGVGDKNSAEFSAAGLTVNGASMTGAPANPAAVRKTEKTTKTTTSMAPAPSATPPVASTTTAPMTTAKTTPAAAPMSMPAASASTMSAADKKAAAKQAKDDKKAAKADEKAAKKAAKAASSAAAASASAKK